MPTDQEYNAHPRFGFTVQRLRTAAGESQADLAAELGVRKSTVYSWEAGRAECSLGMLERIASHYSVSCDYLLKGEEAMVRVQVRHLRLVVQDAIRAYSTIVMPGPV